MNAILKERSIEEQLNETAKEDLFALLEQHNELSDDHIGALSDVIETYSRMAFMSDDDRLVRAFPLSMGLGKTQSIASWCAAVSRLGLEDVSMVICGEQLEELNKLRRGLRKKGVPADRIGFFHSDKKDPKLTPCSTGEYSDYQFILVAHQLVRTRTDIDELNWFGDRERSLCVWDESLVRNEGGCLSAVGTKVALAVAEAYTLGGFLSEENQA